MNKLSEIMRARRKALNLTQQDIAVELNVSNKAVSKWETGECLPESAQLKPLANILGVTVDELLGGLRSEDEKDIEDDKNIEKRVPKETVSAQAPKMKPWRKLLIAALCTAVFGIVVFFLFIIAFGTGREAGSWALGILLFFISLAVVLTLIALIVYLFEAGKEAK